MNLENIKTPFLEDIKERDGKLYLVGGAVRDHFLNKPIKDLDFLITGVDLETIKNILLKYGTIDLVGSSFGVIKFREFNSKEVIDISLPRTELANGNGGYRDFNVKIDHKLPIETDLKRRDTTFNSMAYDLIDKKLVDPYGGLNDLKDGIIRATSETSFLDDPLRMLRVIVQASIFNFKIDKWTLDSIKENAKNISKISKERILVEFDKVVNRGNPKLAAESLVDSNLYEYIFGIKFYGNFSHFNYVKKNSEFIYWLIEPFTEQPDEYYKNIMRGDINTSKEISALAYLYNNLPDDDKIKQRFMYFNLNKITPKILDSNYVLSLLNDVVKDFEKGEYPLTYKDLKIDGNILVDLGFKGVNIGKILDEIILMIFSDVIRNDKNDILKYIEENKNTLNEVVIKTELENDKKKVVFFDFDATLIDSPLPEIGKIMYKKKTGFTYPYEGWWGRVESLDMSLFDIQTHPQIEAKFRDYKSNPNVHVVLLTNRIPRLEKVIKNVLEKHGMYFDIYSFKNNHINKGGRILKIMENQFPNIFDLEFYDDDMKNIQDVRNSLIDTKYVFKVNHVVNGVVRD